MTLSEQYDRQTAEIMRRTLAADASCVDVGCNVGAILAEILRVAPHGHHYAFEPLPDRFHDFYGTTPEHIHGLLVGDCGLEISLMADWLAARPALTRQGLHDQFHGQSNYHFLAHPAR